MQWCNRVMWLFKPYPSYLTGKSAQSNHTVRPQFKVYFCNNVLLSGKFCNGMRNVNWSYRSHIRHICRCNSVESHILQMLQCEFSIFLLKSQAIFPLSLILDYWEILISLILIEKWCRIEIQRGISCIPLSLTLSLFPLEFFSISFF